jgi:hypothetical protein
VNAEKIAALHSQAQPFARPACQRCGHRDKRGLANMRGILLCSVCALVAIAKCRLAR